MSFSYRKLQESSSSHNIPHVSLPSTETKQSPQILPYSTSNTLDLCNPSSSHSSNTPQFKKKLFTEALPPPTSKRESCGSVSKHKSFDYASSKRPHPSKPTNFSHLCFTSILQFFFVSCFVVIDSPTVSLVRSGSFMSSPRQPTIIKKSNIEGNNCGGSDDSMHEKYFKSVENTPVSKRRNQPLACSTSQQKHSSDSSPHSPMSPKKNVSQIKYRRIRNNIIYNIHYLYIGPLIYFHTTLLI